MTLTTPSQAQMLFLAANAALATADLSGAETVLRQALVLQPEFGEAYANLAWVREQQGALDEAEGCYRQAIDLGVANPQLYLNYGVLLMQAKRFDEAELLTRRALELAPQLPAAWSNLGVVLACRKREAEAEDCYRRALALDDGYAKAHVNLAYILLRQGRLDEGWRHLEARDQYPQIAQHFAFPRWRGEDLSGKALVITFEVGHGDMIQFCRYASVLKRQGAARVSVVCHPALKRLFASLHGVDQAYSFGDDVPRTGWDYWSPPLSLPHWCRTRLDNIPAAVPYLAADAERQAHWAKLLPPARPRVGLVWKGNPAFENDADRSLPSLAALAPLASVAGIDFVSLQKGAGEDEAHAPPAGMTLAPLGETLDDFADTVALLAHLDLVISVDTGVAHLAGALGIPCWLLLPDYKPDWRWLDAREDTPWYPATRLFRQPHGGGWEPVVARLAIELAGWKEARDADSGLAITTQARN